MNERTVKMFIRAGCLAAPLLLTEHIQRMPTIYVK